MVTYTSCDIVRAKTAMDGASTKTIGFKRKYRDLV